MQPPLADDVLLAELRPVIINALGVVEGSTLLNAVSAIPDADERAALLRDIMADIETALDGQETQALATRDDYRERPVGVKEFVCSPYYLNKADEIYPIVLDELEEMNSGKYVEIVLTGGIGSGKTTSALYTNAYQLYLLSCLYEPHKLYGLDPSSEILLIFQSITATLAKGVDYKRFRSMIELSPYFQHKFQFDKKIESRLVFPHRIEVAPLSGNDTAAIGQNVMGGLIDELNYMAIVEKSAKNKNIDKGEYDQAVAIYNSISRRRKSRFMKQGKLPGILCLVSSKKYPGQFTDIKEQESLDEMRRTGKTSIYVYDKRIWEIAPPGRFSGKWFRIFIGDESRKPRILDDDDLGDITDEVGVDGRSLVMLIPEEYRPDFERDIMGSLRDIAGVSTLALFPFFTNRENVAEMFGHQPSILSDTETDFHSKPLKILPSKIFQPQHPRWVHIDLSINKDSTGITMGCVPGFCAINRGNDDFETMPQIYIDFQLRVTAPPGGEILYYKIRSLIYALRERGINIKWISLDSFQSVDMQQILRQQGFTTGDLSMDKTTLPYEVLKTACYDGRVSAPTHKHCEKELIGLEMNPKTVKIDHSPTGSKDVADSLAGVVYGLTMRREIWSEFDVPVVRMPGSIQQIMDRERERMKSEGDYAGLLRKR